MIRQFIKVSSVASLMWSNLAYSESLTLADVDQIVSQAVAEATAHVADDAVIAVVDRMGNVLGVYAMNPSALPDVTISSGRGIPTGNGLEGLTLPITSLATISKAITGAYLSSSGNAFTSRTASQIVQENFNPGEHGQPGGPLFGVQFSQLPCSDMMRFGEELGVGPRRSPLGISADPGGLPLYKNGQVVGGVGVLADGVYGLDLSVADFDRDLDEMIAVAAQQDFEPPENIKSHRIAVEGKLLRYADVNERFLRARGASATLDNANYIPVPGYAPAGRRAGLAYGSAASGITLSDDIDVSGTDGVFVLSDGAGNNRYAPRSSLAPSPSSGGMTAEEVRTILTQALTIAFRARAQIRRPFGSHAQVSVSIVDTEANILAIARTPDAPIFGTDVSLQKARTATFASRPTTAAELSQVASVDLLPGILTIPPLSTYVEAVQSFVGPTALADGTAFC